MAHIQQKVNKHNMQSTKPHQYTAGPSDKVHQYPMLVGFLISLAIAVPLHIVVSWIAPHLLCVLTATCSYLLGVYFSQTWEWHYGKGDSVTTGISIACAVLGYLFLANPWSIIMALVNFIVSMAAGQQGVVNIQTQIQAYSKPKNE